MPELKVRAGEKVFSVAANYFCVVDWVVPPAGIFK